MSEDHSWRVSRNRHTEEHPQWGERRTEPGADHKVRSEIGKERKQRVFSVCDGGEAGEVEVHRQKVFHGFSKLYVEKMIEMTDADIVRAPFFKHHINEIIGNRVGMVVALVQLYLFLRTPAVDAGGKCKLHTTEQEQCKASKTTR